MRHLMLAVLIRHLPRLVANVDQPRPHPTDGHPPKERYAKKGIFPERSHVDDSNIQNETGEQRTSYRKHASRARMRGTTLDQQGMEALDAVPEHRPVKDAATIDMS